MRTGAMKIGLIGGFLALSMVQAGAMSLGEFEYRNSCAQCHGDSGEGGGAVAAFLTKLPPDLTVLTRDNGGVFPVQRMYEVIEGTADIGVHGRNMPLWGNRYRENAALIEDLDADFPFDPARDSEGYVQARILSVIEYLSKLQKE